MRFAGIHCLSFQLFPNWSYGSLYKKEHIWDQKTKPDNLWVVPQSRVKTLELDHKTPEKLQCDGEAKRKKSDNFLILYPTS